MNATTTTPTTDTTTTTWRVFGTDSDYRECGLWEGRRTMVSIEWTRGGFVSVLRGLFDLNAAFVLANLYAKEPLAWTDHGDHFTATQTTTQKETPQ